METSRLSSGAELTVEEKKRSTVIQQEEEINDETILDEDRDQIYYGGSAIEEALRLRKIKPTLWGGYDT